MRSLAVLAAALAGCDPEPDACDDVPIVTWETFGESFVLHNCQTCHASTAPDRHGAPSSTVFDTEQHVLDRADEILARVMATDARRMPPAGGVGDDDLERLGVWLGCGGH